MRILRIHSHFLFLPLAFYPLERSSKNLMGLGGTFRKRNLFPIAGVTIAALLLILNLAIVWSRRGWNIIGRLIRVAAGNRWFVWGASGFRRH
jgi:hypothetical protein